MATTSLRTLAAVQRLLTLAISLALALVFLFPANSKAHAILLTSNPAKDAVLYIAPSTIHMEFSEDLNPTFSTAAVVNAANQRVDARDAHVIASRQMDVTLQPNLPPAVYVVVWRTQSADDGHILTGSFLFNIAQPDGTIPKLNGALPNTNVLGGGGSGLASGQLDGPTLFSFLMILLVELGTIFWVGAQLWHTFVLQLSETDSQEQQAIEQETERRFERVFALPVLLGLLIANVGVLVGQGLTISGGRWETALTPTVLTGLVSAGYFGTYWTLREVVLLAALALATYTWLYKGRSRAVDGALSWANLSLSLGLLIALALSGHASAVDSDHFVYAVLADWLHLLAAALWIGGMLYLAVIYLPLLRGRQQLEQAHSLLTILPRFSLLAISGVVIMAVTGPFNATVHMNSFAQLTTTLYGRALVVKVLLVITLLLTSAFHVGLLRPRLKRDYLRYAALHATVAGRERTVLTEEDALQEPGQQDRGEQREVQAEEHKSLEKRVSLQTSKLTTILRWEPVLGIAVLLCTALMNIFAGTLLPATSASPTAAGKAPTKPFATTLQTDDKKYTLQVYVSPNHFGPNLFTVKVHESTGAPASGVGVSIYTTMLDMDMGTDTVNLQPTSTQGTFSASGDLGMGGNWQLRIQIRAPDNTLHEAKVKLLTI